MSLFSFLFRKKATAVPSEKVVPDGPKSNPGSSGSYTAKAENNSPVEDVRKSRQDAGEIILNLWYITNRYYITTLLSKAYLASGTDEEMIALLKQRSRTDYNKAQKHDVPAAMKHSIELYGEDGKKTTLNECTHQFLEMMGGYNELFREIIRNYPTYGHKYDPANALVCKTALVIEQDGSLSPQVNA